MSTAQDTVGGTRASSLISFARLLLGIAVPAGILCWLFLPASVLVRLQPIDWAARYEEAKTEATGKRGPFAMLPVPRTVPSTLEAFIADETGGRTIEVRGPEWTRLADGVRRTVQGNPPDGTWRRRLGRPGSLYAESVFFSVGEGALAEIGTRGRELTAVSGSWADVAVDVGSGERRDLGLTLLSLSDVYTQAPMDLVFPRRRLWPAALLAAAAFVGIFLWPKLPRRRTLAVPTCPVCRSMVGPGAQFCPRCGGSVESPDVPAPELPLSWEVHIPLLRNPFFLADGTRLVAIVMAIMMTLMGGIALFGPGADAFRGLLTLTALVMAGFVLLALPIALFLDLVGHTERAVVSSDGAGVSVSRSARAIAKAAAVANVVGGALAGRPGTVGIGLIGATTMDRGVTWADVRRVEVYPACLVVVVHEAWPTSVRLYCPDEATYEAVLAAIRRLVPAAGGTVLARRSWFGRAFASCVVAVLAAVAGYMLLG